MTDTRPSIDKYFMEMARLASSRSTCVSRKVGAVAVIDKHLIATGYNGVSRDIEHPIVCLRKERGIEQGKETFLCGCVHAEMSVVTQAAFHGTSLRGATVYTTHQPCHLCAMLLVNAGIARVVYDYTYPDTDGLALLHLARIEVRHMAEW